MVKRIQELLSMFASFVMVLVIGLVLSGCAGYNYQFGDISRVYCGTTNHEIRADLKATLENKGVKIGLDYCAGFGLADALIDRERGE